MARISIETGAPAASKAPAKSSGGEKSRGAASGKASLDQAAKMKLLGGVVVLLIGVGVISWNLGLGELIAPTKLSDKDLYQGGQAPTPEQEQQNQTAQKKATEKVEEFVKKNGGGGA